MNRRQFIQALGFTTVTLTVLDSKASPIVATESYLREDGLVSESN